MAFKKTLDKSDFGLADESTQSVSNGKWNVIGEFTVPPQQKYAYGYGSSKAQANQGYLYLFIKDDTDTEIEGKVRLVQEDANGLKKFVVYEEQEAVLHGDQSDRQQKNPLPEQAGYPLVGEDSRMKIEFNPESDSATSYTNSKVYIPVTVRTK